MYRDYNVVAFIPAGRKKTMSTLLKYLDMNKDIIDEVQVWYNPAPDDKANQKWLKTLENDYVKLYHVPKHYKRFDNPIQFNTGRFYEYTVDPNTIYIRFDDDIVYIHEDAIRNLLDFRIDNQQYLVTFASIWNNAVISYIMQNERPAKIGRGDYQEWTVNTPYCMDEVGWGNGEFGVYIHELLLGKIRTGTVPELYMNGRADNNTRALNWMGSGYELKDANRFSISCFAFFGRDWASIDGKFPEPELGKMDEEVYIAEVWPRELGRDNAICGNAIISHYTFSPYQKPVIEKTDILEQYKEIANKKYEAIYYNLLQDSQPEASSGLEYDNLLMLNGKEVKLTEEEFDRLSKYINRYIKK